MKKHHQVYHLVDPDTGAVKYVGKSVNAKSRFRSHIKESIARQNTRKKRWIYELVRAGKTPVLIVVAEYEDEAVARKAESAECHKHVETILNIHDPAKGAADISDEKKKKKDKQ